MTGLTPVTPSETPANPSLISADQTPETPETPAETPETPAEPTPESIEADKLAAEAAAAKETKEAAEASQNSDDPITYDDLTLPEDFDTESESAVEFLDLINSNIPKSELVQKLIEMETDYIAESLQSWVDTNKEWQKELETDPEIGGDKLDAHLGQISKSIDAYALENSKGDPAQKLEHQKQISTALRDAFSLTGAGNQPDIVKYLIWTATQLSEGAPLSGTPAGGEASRAQKLFG